MLSTKVQRGYRVLSCKKEKKNREKLGWVVPKSGCDVVVHVAARRKAEQAVV